MVIRKGKFCWKKKKPIRPYVEINKMYIERTYNENSRNVHKIKPFFQKRFYCGRLLYIYLSLILIRIKNCIIWPSSIETRAIRSKLDSKLGNPNEASISVVRPFAITIKCYKLAKTIQWLKWALHLFKISKKSGSPFFNWKNFETKPKHKCI